MYRQILVPIDESDLLVDTSTKAVAFAKSIGANIVFFHACSDFGATDDGSLVRVISPELFSANAATCGSATLAKAEIAAREAGVPYKSIARTSDRPYAAILDAAEETGCDLIFMSSHGRRGLKGLFLGSQTQKVLARTTIPVLVSAVESNASTPEMNAALSVIRGEHRSLAAIMHNLTHIVQQTRIQNGQLDSKLIRTIVLYFRRFSRDLHHSKEEQYLFGRLLGYVPDTRETIRALEAQHKEEPRLIDAIEFALEEYERSPGLVMLGLLEEATDRYAERLWHHMSLEEDDILHLCRKYFTKDDWKQIAHAFAENGDPRFDRDKEAEFEHFLQQRIAQSHTHTS